MAQFIALTSKGIEPLLLDELVALGASDVKQSVQSVSFSASMQCAYDVCLWSRLASRVLMLISSAEVESADDVYRGAKAIKWHEYFRVSQSFAIDFIGSSDFIKNTQFGGLTVKDAVADYFVDCVGERPSVDKYSPDVVVQARLWRNKVSFYVDFSGPSLHQRGYREGQGGAPLKENLAAAIVLRSGWLKDTSRPLLDPFCGSGTLLIEAVHMANNTAPGLSRDEFAFERLEGFDSKLLDERLTAAKSKESVVADLNVIGSDVNQKLVHIARENAASAGVGQLIDFRKTDATKIKKSQKQPGVIVCNPPYGERLGHMHELAQLYAQFGVALKQHFCHWQLAFFTQDVSPVKQLRLAKSKVYKFRNGPLDCELFLFDLTERQCQMNDPAIGAGQLVYNFKESDSFYNRLKKNDKKFKSLAKREKVNCYRIYDADIPEYNVAVDRYDDKVVVFEYAPPKSVDANTAQKRLADVMAIVPNVLNVPYEDVALKVRQKQKGSQQYQAQDKQHKTFVVQEYGVNLQVNIHDYLDTGLFLDHRITRKMVGDLSKGKSVLNLFAYTGTASVHAALNGASQVTTVDMSKTYLDWAKENFELNGLKVRADAKKYPFVQADCLQWLETEAGNDSPNQYDVIFCDPPTFSNSKRMEKTFDVLRDHVELLTHLKALLAPGGTIVFSNNHRRFKLDMAALDELGLQVEDVTKQTLPFDFQRNSKIHQCWVIKR